MIRLRLALFLGIAVTTTGTAQPGGGTLDSVRAMVKQTMAERGIPSVAIAVGVGGRIVWEEAFGWADVARKIPAAPTTMYSLASISKPITATGLMIQVARQKVALDRPVNDYLADAPVTAFEGNVQAATVRRVANHTAGLPLHYRFFYHDRPVPRPTMDEAIRRYGVLVAPPGAQFTYSNLGYGILERIIERTSGVDFAAFMRRDVFEPLGLGRMAIVTAPIAGDTVAERYDGQGRPISWYDFDHRGASAVYASARDLARFGLFHLGHRIGAPILPPAALDTMHRATARRAETVGYGIGWQTFEDDYGYRSHGHSGGMPGVATVLRIYPEADLVVVVLTNAAVNDAASRIAAEAAAAFLPRFKARLAEATARPAGPTTPPGFEPAAELLGEWAGSITTWNGPVPIRLSIGPDSIQAAIGGAASVGATNPRWQGGRLTATVPGTLPTPDQSGPGSLTLDLRPADSRLTGSISALAPNIHALSSYLRLERVR